MAVKLKPIEEQTIVITGASSGIGLATARMAARQGARVVFASRDEPALRQLEMEIIDAGGQALAVQVDVSNVDDVRRLADVAIARFGSIDTWVNNAAVAIYARADETEIGDARRLFDVNFWGQVYGSKTAMDHFKQQGVRNGYGSALINVGSTESDRALPLHSMYSASKHAIKGFTDAMRMELEEAGVPVSVTLIKPGSINTPFTEHARNYMGNEPDYPPPVYDPSVVAETIIYAATHPVRDLFAGGGGKMISAMGTYLPRITDWFMKQTMFKQQQKDVPTRTGDNLTTGTRGELQEHGSHPGHVMRSSLYSKATMHPLLTLAIIGAAGLAIAAAANPPSQVKRRGSLTRRRDGVATRLRDLVQ
ncbi:MAG TPA: SDR family oxidoreductase [Tepidisphaeraceae bacterium]|jgi:NAD(P)-dependent dehydrogenase (short-subunit alcohol dehydrogenase family)|nr:SDR family oxidoreductase [Tepidisphaeraceae bacterium]